MSLYQGYEMTHAAITPMRAAARLSQEVIRNPLNPMAEHYGSRAVSAALEMFINATRRYGKPEWAIDETIVDGVEAPVDIEPVWTRPFCNLVHFQRLGQAENRNDPPVLVIAPTVLAVCQPGIPAMAAASLMAINNHPARPSSLTLMGSPIDTARIPSNRTSSRGGIRSGGSSGTSSSGCHGRTGASCGGVVSRVWWKLEGGVISG